MNLEPLTLTLIGGGKMGLALLHGWLAQGLDPKKTIVVEPSPSQELIETGVRLNSSPGLSDVVVLAVKPQIIPEVLAKLELAKTSLVISVAAGCPLRLFENAFGTDQKIIRAMPNTPAAVGAGITAIIGNEVCDASSYKLTTALLKAVGEVIRLNSEADMDAVTGLSGSGPAYVFHMIEAMTEAGIALGLDPRTARALARATVSGAGKLVEVSGEDASILRQNVTSPGGTTYAGLQVLMDETNGLSQLMKRTIAAATARSKELGQS